MSRGFTSISGSLLAIVGTSTALVLWLIISFWVDAFIQRQDATALRDTTLTENTIFDVSVALASQRMTNYDLVVGYASADRLQIENHIRQKQASSHRSIR